jgi:hypothetical protein
MKTTAIVPDLNIVCDRSPDMPAGREHRSMHHLVLQQSEEGLRERVIPPHPGTAPRRQDLVVLEQLMVFGRGVLRSTVGTEHTIFDDVNVAMCHLQCVTDQRNTQVVGQHGPVDRRAVPRRPGSSRCCRRPARRVGVLHHRSAPPRAADGRGVHRTATSAADRRKSRRAHHRRHRHPAPERAHASHVARVRVRAASSAVRSRHYRHAGRASSRRGPRNPRGPACRGRLAGDPPHAAGLHRRTYRGTQDTR